MSKLLKRIQSLKSVNQQWSNAMHVIHSNQLLNGLQSLKILHDCTTLLMLPNEKERKTNIDDIKSCSTRELLENAWDSFLSSVKTKHQNYSNNVSA